MTKAKNEEPKDGMATTDEGKKVELTPPAVTDTAAVDPELVEKARMLTEEEADNLAGELEPGEEGWIPLDEHGTPTGPAQKGEPPKDQLAARVVAPASPPRQAVMTPSGAPITKQMNPDPTINAKPDRDYNAIAEEEAKRREDRRRNR
jgi:hypothetical protein